MASVRKKIFFTLLVFTCVFSVVLSGCGRKEADMSKGKTDTQKTATRQVGPSTKPITEERTFYGYETNLQGWEVPVWAASKSDYIASNLTLSKDSASEGTSSMKIDTDFPGGIWSAALVEIQQYLDMSAYRVIRADIYLPEDAPEGLKAKIILTVGENWKFVEMNQAVPLIPGEWVTVTANIEPGSYDWKRVIPDAEFAKDIRKIAIRIVSNRTPQYTGPVYVDNVRAGR